MGKSSNLKKLKPLVLRTIKNLPPCIAEYPTGKRLLGEELLKQGVTEVEGKPIIPGNWYRQTSTIVKYISHYKECMDYVKRMGEAGIPAYLMWLAGHRAKMKAKYPHFDPDPAKVEATKTKMTADPRLDMLGETIVYEKDLNEDGSIKAYEEVGTKFKSSLGMEILDIGTGSKLAELSTGNNLEEELAQLYDDSTLIDEAIIRQKEIQSPFRRSRVNLMGHTPEASNPDVNSIPEDDETL